MKRKLAAVMAVVMLLLTMTQTAGATGLMDRYKELLKSSGSLSLLISKDSIWEFEEGGMVSSVDWEMLELDEESAQAYPELAAALEEINADRDEQCRGLSDELTDLGLELYEEGGIAVTCSAAFHCYVQRADQKVLSFRSDSEIYWGGMHADYGTAGINLDPVTGGEIALSDVVTDIPAMIALLADKLEKEYPEEDFSNLESELMDFSEDEFEWTLGQEWITFYFDPYVLLDYASGKATAVIRYDEAEALFNQEYLPVSREAYAVGIPLYEEVDYDSNPADGKTNAISLGAVMGEYDAYEHLWIMLGDEVYSEEIWAYSMQAYLIAAGTGEARKNFLYLETVQENDYTTLHVYDLNGDMPVKAGEMWGTGFAGSPYSGKEVFADPMSFTLETWMEILGTRFGVREYSVDGQTGMPVPKQEYYEIEGFGFPLSSLREMKATMLDTNVKETLPAGTEFYELRTDGESYMDFRLNDGRECRIEVDTSGYPALIDGIPEDECFEGIMYAG